MRILPGYGVYSMHTSIDINLMYAKMREIMTIQVEGGMLQQLPNNNTATQGGYDVYGGGDMFIEIDQ